MLLLSWVKRGLGFVLRFVIRFFFRSLNRAMGCFFACFRVKDRDHQPRPHLISTSSRSTDVLISRNHVTSVFPSQEGENSASNDGVGSQGDELGLKDEAKFLKACGTLAGTPPEIRKASEKLKVSPSCDKDPKPSRFHSWLPNTSPEKFQLDVQQFNLPTPLKPSQELGDSTDSIEHTPSRCMSNARDNQHGPLECAERNKTESLHTSDSDEKNVASVSPCPVTDTLRKSKSVRFQCDTGFSSSGSSTDDWKKNRTPNNQSANKRSPYPTPLKLFDEMQTPGTVCPATLEEVPNVKPRVRSQFVYPVHKPDENVFRCKVLEERDLNDEQDSSGLSDSVEQAQNSTPTSKKVSHEVSAAAHFGDENSKIRPPKWWDGNGIPNTTTKYKEDQKVNWHATPFEERLEKALSQESSIPHRKLAPGTPIPFDDIEEKNTALPQL